LSPGRPATEKVVDAFENRRPSPPGRLAVSYFLELVGIELCEDRQDLADAQVVVVRYRENDLVAPVVAPEIFPLPL